MTTYAARFQTALAEKLGPLFTVTDMGQNLYSIEHRGGMSSPVFGPDRPDRRKPVADSDVADAVERVVSSLQRAMPHYTEDAQAKGRLFLDAVQQWPFTEDNVWLRMVWDDDRDDSVSEAEANVYREAGGDDYADAYRVDWSLTAVGLVKSRRFPSYAEAAEWLRAEGFDDYTS